MLGSAPSQALGIRTPRTQKAGMGWAAKVPVECVASDHTAFTLLHCAPATPTFLLSKLIPASGPLQLFPLPARFFQGSFPVM